MKYLNTLKQNSEIKQTANQQLVKESNLALIFSLISKYDSISRAELAVITKLSPTTVSSLTEELLRKGVILETGLKTLTSSGRRPIILEVNPDGGFVYAVEISSYGYIISLYNIKCNEISSEKHVISDFLTIGADITESIANSLKNKNIDDNKLLGICIGVPGIIDLVDLRVVSSTVVPIDRNNNFCNIIKNAYPGIPVLIGNESGFCAYAEKEYGNVNSVSVSNLIYIDINLGIGSGIILDNHVFMGSTGLAGEIGHISIDFNGPKCKCGNKGCLEVMASIPAMTQRIIFELMSGYDTIISKLINNEYNKITIEVIRDALDKKDRLALDVVDETAKRLAFGINNVINTINPETIIIGGEITKLGNIFLEKIKYFVREIGFSNNANKVAIQFSEIKGNAVTLGAARFVLDNIFDIDLLRGSIIKKVFTQKDIIDEKTIIREV